MKIVYKVHSASTEDVPVTATVGGREVRAMVPGLTVELVGEGEHAAMGHTYKFVPHGDEDMNAHKAMFEVGKTVTVTFGEGDAA